MPLEGKALCLKENPEYPYVAVSFQHGLLMLMSIYDVDKLTFLTSFYLTRNPLSSIYFAEVGKRLVTADMNDGQFFIINVSNIYIIIPCITDLWKYLYFICRAIQVAKWK